MAYRAYIPPPPPAIKWVVANDIEGVNEWWPSLSYYTVKGFLGSHRTSGTDGNMCKTMGLLLCVNETIYERFLMLLR